MLFSFKVFNMVCNGTIEPEKLPPTEEAAEYHGLRVDLQVVQWKILNKSFNLVPTDWGWKENENHLIPIPTTKEVAPENLLKVIRCKCKSTNNQCGTNVCTCRKHGIKCMPACGGCHGENCKNKMVSLFNKFATNFRSSFSTFDRHMAFLSYTKVISYRFLASNNTIKKSVDYIKNISFAGTRRNARCIKQ